MIRVGRHLNLAIDLVHTSGQDNRPVLCVGTLGKVLQLLEQ